MPDRFGMLLVSCADDMQELIDDEGLDVDEATAEVIISVAVDILAASGIECTCGAEHYTDMHLRFDHPCLCHSADCDLMEGMVSAFRQAIRETIEPEEDPDLWRDEEIQEWRGMGLL